MIRLCYSHLLANLKWQCFLILHKNWLYIFIENPISLAYIYQKTLMLDFLSWRGGMDHSYRLWLTSSRCLLPWNLFLDGPTRPQVPCGFSCPTWSRAFVGVHIPLFSCKRIHHRNRRKTTSSKIFLSAFFIVNTFLSIKDLKAQENTVKNI